MSIMTPRDDDRKPFPSLPSPTLTNPDMVLPDEPRTFSTIPSPPRNARRERPPSPGYLRHRADDVSAARAGRAGDASLAGRREKRGLMSRKMLLLRSRTASNGYENQRAGSAPSPRSQAHRGPPELMDVGNLAPEEHESKWSNDESSAESEDMSGLPQFLAKYKQGTASGTDDDELDGSTAVDRYTYAPSTRAGSSDAERIQKEKDEQHSAILSKRAEQILANAKKRLNLMEGNLRGARDLVAPLTAANLKRATSVASYVPPINNYGGINRYVEGHYHYNADTRQSYRTLHAQASNPVLSRDYQGHWRGYSETNIHERPSTALDGADSSPIVAQGLIPTKAADPAWTRTLKGSRSHDSLGVMSLHQPGARDQYRNKGSPDPNLEPVAEDDGPVYSQHSSTSSRANSRAESHRNTSTPEDLHEQMSSLRGRISALKERAREDSLRRRSMQTMREPSPLNNATSNAPELFYTSSPTYGPTGLDTQAGVGYTGSQRHDDITNTQSAETPTPTLTGSRNAFAEQAQRQQQREPSTSSGTVSTSLRNSKSKDDAPPTSAMHKRTPSGTAIVQSSKHRYSHHQYAQVHDMQDTYGTDEPSGEEEYDDIGTAHDGSSRYGDDEQSEVNASVYEDASSEPSPVVVAHEDREDAFDYENFFLHSAMSYYASDARRGSFSSDVSTDSVSTARGPAAADVLASYAEYDSESDSYLPPEPKTPEKLRRIERTLHHRTFSDESMTSFATATEGHETPERLSVGSSAISSARISTAMEWPVPPTDSPSGSATVVPVKPRQIEIARSDSSSERADSGVGLNGSQDAPRGPPQSTASTAHHKSSLSSSATLTTPSMLSPPVSPRAPVSQDPATLAVNALLLPNGRRLGLRDKALMFGLVESLKTLCHQLQEGQETSHESRMLRRRLDDARRVLAGGSEIRPGTS